MTIEFLQGYKSPNDKKIVINGHVIKFSEVAQICIQLVKNEDEIYPKSKGFRGGDMLIDFLTEAMNTRQVTPQLLAKYKLSNKT